jgi:hypothetical protein
MPENIPPVRKTKIWPIVLGAIIIVIGGAGYYFYSNYVAGNRWKPILQQELKDLVIRSTDSLYHIEYSDFDLNITNGSATLADFRLLPDTVVYQKLAGMKKAPDNLFILSVKKLTIKNIGAKKAYQEKILNIDKITIENPELTIINKRYNFNEKVKVGKPINPYQVIKNVFKQVRIDSVALNDISLTYINKNKKAEKRNTLKHLDIGISDIVVDSLSGSDPARFYYTRGVDVTIHDYHIATPDSLYKASLGKIFFSTSERKIVLDKVSYTPRYNHTDFYRQTGKGGDIYNINLKQIAINDIDLQSFLRDQVLYAGTVDIYKPDLHIYNNNAIKGTVSEKIGKDPHQELQNVALAMKFKRLNIKNASISYAEADATSGATGEILFTHTNGYILNVTNDDDQKRRNPFMKAFINTRFMDAAALSVNFKFNLTDKKGAFNYSGELGTFDGRILDKLVKPLALVHVQSADIEKLTFNVNANNYGGKGSLEFYYKNLNIQLLKKVDGKAGLQKQGLLSLLANKLIIEPNNPDNKGVFRPGPIDLKRDATTSFFSFLYQGLLDGLKPSVGFDKKTEANVNTAIIKVSNLVDKLTKLKNDYKAKREARKKERQAKKDSVNQAKTMTH